MDPLDPGLPQLVRDKVDRVAALEVVDELIEATREDVLRDLLEVLGLEDYQGPYSIGVQLGMECQPIKHAHVSTNAGQSAFQASDGYRRPVN
jgi:hypothetical protein